MADEIKEFNTEPGVTVARELLIAFLNTGTKAAPVWSPVGKRVEDSSMELDWQTEQKTDIFGDTYTTGKKATRIVADMPGEIAKQESEFEKLVSTVDKLNQKLISYDDQLSQANETLAQQTTQAGELTRQLSVGEPGAPDSSPKASQKETAKSAEQAAKGFTRMREAADKAKGSVSGLARAGAAIGRTVVAGVKAAASAFAAMGRAAVTAFAAAGRGILSFVGHMNVFSRLTSGLGGKISRLGTMIKQAFVFNVISQGLNALRSQMSAYLSTNAAFSGALSNLQASLSTAFQPILDAAVPALVTLMNVLSSVITVIGRFLAALASIGGRAKTNTKALGAQAKATGGAGGAAEKAAKSLAKFDEINRLADDSAGGGGGGGGGGGDFDVDDFPEYEFDGVFKTWGEAFNAFLDTIIDDGLPRLEKALDSFAIWLNRLSGKAGAYALFAGGDTALVTFSDYVDSYDADLTHSAADALSEGRTDMAAASVGNYALFGGGQSGSNNHLSSVVDAYDALLTRSTPTPLVKNERCKAAANSSYAVFCGTMISAYNTSLTRSIPSLPSWVNSSIAISSITATRAGNYILFSYSSSKPTAAYDLFLTRTEVDGLVAALPMSINMSGATLNDHALLLGAMKRGSTSNYDAVITVYDPYLVRTSITPSDVPTRQNGAATTIGKYALFGGGSQVDKYGYLNGYESRVDAFQYK